MGALKRGVAALVAASILAVPVQAEASYRGCVIGPHHQRIGVNCPHRPTSGVSSIGPVYQFRVSIAPSWVKRLWFIAAHGL